LMSLMEDKRRWIMAAAGGLVAVVAGIWIYKSVFGYSTEGEDSRNRWFVCAETRKPFRAHLEIGESIPVMSPFSHKATGYPAELCYWTKEGTIKSAPDYVLLNRYLNPNDNSPTFCPDCGRLVVGHNPAPVAGHAPPPTQEEWMQRHGGGAGANTSRE
jgi:hypothetical protein